nr:adenylate/guanylate cyclase domain-containing protein [Ramlibacter monticola]
MTPPGSTEHAPRLTRSTKVIAVADVVESVRLMEQDEQEFIRRWQSFVGFVQQRLPADSGRIHKSLGDGLMLEFSDPQGCVRAALAMRAWFADSNERLPPEDRVQLRIGAHLADFVADEYDIYGTDVNLAARIASLAGPGEIVISAALRRHLGAQPAMVLQDLGSCHLKHVKEPVHAFRIGEAGQAPVMPVRRLATHSLRPTVAVLPFGMERPAAGGLTGEALADDIVAALADSDQLQVVSRLSTAPFVAGKASLDAVRRTLGAHYVLTGRARGAATRLSLYVELADAITGHVAWAQSFRGPLREADLGEGRLMREVVTALHSAVVSHELERSRDLALPALEGFTLLLSSIGVMHRLAAADLERARAMLEHLVDRGRGHPGPHAWLAHLHLLRLRQHGAGNDGMDADKARQHAESAMQCDAGAVAALAMHGQALLYASHDAEAADECYAQALSTRPDDPLTLVLQAELRALQGRGEVARELAARALAGGALAPMRYLYEGVGALAALVAGDLREAAASARRAVQRNPQYLPALRTLIVAQVLDGEVAEARRSTQRLAARRPVQASQVALQPLPACSRVADCFAEALQRAAAPPG